MAITTLEHITSGRAMATPDWGHWRTWVAPRPYDWVPLCLAIGVLLDCLVQAWGYLTWLPAISMILSLLALISLDRWEYWRYGDAVPERVRVLLLLGTLILVELVVQIGYFGLAAFLYAVIPLKVALGFGQRTGVLAGIGVLALYMLKHALCLCSLAEYLSNTMLFATAIVFVLTLARMTILERYGREQAEALVLELEESHAELAAYASQSADMATTAERNRLARDIHDSLGHYLTAINIQLEKALAFQQLNPAESQAAVISSKRMASEALEDVRHSVGMLRSSNQDLSIETMLRQLIEGWGETPIIFNISGTPTSLAMPARLVLFRAVQEGLTNIRRHAQAQSVRIELHYQNKQVALQISDDGIGFTPEQIPTHGYGLRGLQERVAILGGMLQITSDAGQGSTVTITIPSVG